MSRQRIAILGSTGSIGCSALELVRHHPQRIEVIGLAAYGRQLDLLAEQVEEFRPPCVAVFDPAASQSLQRRFNGRVEVLSGAEGVQQLATDARVDRVVAAMVGAAGLPPVHAALAAGKDVALANKESLVVAGELLARVAQASDARILPVDSEHVALHQALRSGGRDEVRRLMLTASGGPFRTRPLSTWDQITPKEALAHPTWSMGAKISIDSATLMNKGLELIEASHLFGVPESQIDVVVHPQSIVHSLVEFCDGSWLAQLAINDMVLPIQYALAYPARWPNSFPRLGVEELGSLTFEALDGERFPSVDLARRALRMGPSAPAVINAANEVAVEAFLAGQLGFSAILDLVSTVLDGHEPQAVDSLEQALHWDAWGRRQAQEVLASRAGSG